MRTADDQQNAVAAHKGSLEVNLRAKDARIAALARDLTVSRSAAGDSVTVVRAKPHRTLALVHRSPTPRAQLVRRAERTDLNVKEIETQRNHYLMLFKTNDSAPSEILESSRESEDV